jgi:hypothetical protein
MLSAFNAGSAALVRMAATAGILFAPHPAGLFRLQVDLAHVLQQFVFRIKTFTAYRAVLQYPELLQCLTIELKRN